MSHLGRPIVAPDHPLHRLGVLACLLACLLVSATGVWAEPEAEPEAEAEPTPEATPFEELVPDEHGRMPWESTSARANPFDPLPGFGAESFGPPPLLSELTGLEPIPPVPVAALLPTPTDLFQQFLDRATLVGIMELQGVPTALVRIAGKTITLKSGDRIQLDNLSLEVVGLESATLVLSSTDGELSGLLTLAGNGSLLVGSAGGSLVIRSSSPAQDERPE